MKGTDVSSGTGGSARPRPCPGKETGKQGRTDMGATAGLKLAQAEPVTGPVISLVQASIRGGEAAEHTSLKNSKKDAEGQPSTSTERGRKLMR